VDVQPDDTPMTNNMIQSVDLGHIGALHSCIRTQVHDPLADRVLVQTIYLVSTRVLCGIEHWSFRRMFRQAFIQQHEAT